VNWRGKNKELRIVLEGQKLVPKGEWILLVESKVIPKEREVDSEPKN
jgi:hypothetical protein